MTIRERLLADGYAVLPPTSRDPRETADAWQLVTDLVGVRPEMVERQPIRPIENGRSFASTAVFTPFHTDSQDFLGAPPALQIMICRRAATDGGATRLVDGARLLARLARENPMLHQRLLTEPRHHRFYFGDVVGPTVAIKRGHLVWTHSPLPPTDAIGEALAIELAHEPVITLPIRDGETLVVDNHRMLHGREAFTDTRREYVRLLAWLPRPLAMLSSSASAKVPRIAVVLELLTGVPPARLAAREGISEAELYVWRSRALAAAAATLDDDH
jgi:alpha-ketoglutarate-dependent taurine dioxygenase